jgi:hypothetical protein
MTKDEKHRRSTVASAARLAATLHPPQDRPPQPTDKIKEAGDEKPPENLPQVSRSSHYS